MMIKSVIDTHIHIFERPYGKLFNNSHIKDWEEGELFQYEQYRAKFNITDAFVICHAGERYPGNNDYVKNLSEKLSWIHPFGYLHPDPSSMAEKAKLLVERGFFGLSLFVDRTQNVEWLASPVLQDFWRFIQDRCIPLSINITATQCKYLRTVLDQFPGLIVIISHMGRPRLEGDKLAEDYYSPFLSLSVFKSVYIKLSGFYAFVDDGWRYPQSNLFCVVDRLKEIYGVKKLLYGSDFPAVLEYNTYRQALELLESEYKGFTNAELEDIYYNNPFSILETGNKCRGK